MRFIPLGVLVAFMATSPVEAQELPETSSQIGADCHARLLSENGLEEEDLSRLGAGRAYRLYGRDVVIHAGPASSLCTVAVADELALNYDRAMAALRAERVRSANRLTRAEQAEAAARRETNPYGLTWQPAVTAVQYARGHGEVFAVAVSLYVLGSLWILWLVTPWGEAWRERRRAAYNNRPNGIRIGS